MLGEVNSTGDFGQEVGIFFKDTTTFLGFGGVVFCISSSEFLRNDKIFVAIRILI